MAETRSQALLKEAVMREAEEAVASRFENLEARMQKLDSEFREGLASLFSAINSLTSNSTAGGDRIIVSEIDPSSSNQPQLPDQFRNMQGYSDDPIAQLKNLQETVGISEYHDRFETIRTRVSLPEEYLVSAYLAGLRLDTQMHVKMFQPKSVRHCFQIGKLYETVHPRKSSNLSMAVGSSNPGWNGNRNSFLNKKGVDSKNEGILGQNKPEKKFLTSEVMQDQEIAHEVFDEMPISVQQPMVQLQRSDKPEKVFLPKIRSTTIAISRQNGPNNGFFGADIKGNVNGIASANLNFMVQDRNILGTPPEESDQESEDMNCLDEGPFLGKIKDAHQVFDKMPKPNFGEFPVELISSDSRHLEFVTETFDSCHNWFENVADYESILRSLLGIHSSCHMQGGMPVVGLVCCKISRTKWINTAASVDDVCFGFLKLEQKYGHLGIGFMPYDRGKCSFLVEDEEQPKLTIGEKMVMHLSNMLAVLFLAELSVQFSKLGATFGAAFAVQRSLWDPGGMIKVLDVLMKEHEQIFQWKNVDNGNVDNLVVKVFKRGEICYRENV